MKIFVVAILILGAVVTLDANPEPQLLSSLLGGLTNTGTSKGGLLGSLLDTKGLLSNIIGGPNSLLGGLLGDKGLLSSLLDPKSGIVGGLLAGPNGGLLKGLLDGQNGLLGGVVGLLNQVLCILEHFGLGIVLQLLKVVQLDSILGLNQICQADGGSDLLSLLFKNGLVSLPLVKEVLCMTKSLGLQPVLQLVENIGVGKIVGLSKVNCSGVPILEANSTTSDILSQLLGSLNVNLILSSGLDVVVKLATELKLANVLNVKEVLTQLLCMFKHGLRLNAVVNLVQQLGVDVLLNITNSYCKAGQPLFSDLVKASGLPLEKLLGQVGCLLNTVGLGGVQQLLGQLQLPLLGGLNSVCSAPGVGGLLGSLLQGGLENLEPVICLLKSLPVVGDVVKLVEKLGLEKLLFVGNLTCQGGSSILDLSPVIGILTGITETLNLDVLAGLNLENILDLKGILDSLKGVLDLKGLLNSIVCLVEGLGLKVAIDLLKQVGVTAAIGYNTDLCAAVNGTSGGGVLSVLLNGLGENVLFELLKTLGVPQLLELTDFIIKDGKLLDLDILDNLLCIVSAAGLQPVFDLLKNVGLDKVLGILDFFCKDGQPIRLNNTMDFFANAIIQCDVSSSPECTGAFDALFDTNQCNEICPWCDALEKYSVGAQVQCKASCSGNNCDKQQPIIAPETTTAGVAIETTTYVQLDPTSQANGAGGINLGD